MFCTACKNTFGFWVRYPGQIMINKMVARMLSVVMSISIPLGAAMITFIWVDQTSGPEPIWAAVAVFVMAFVIASGITDVFRCSIDTIFVCAFKDMEEHSPPKHMPDDLKDAFGIDPATRRLTTEIPAGQKMGKKMIAVGKKKEGSQVASGTKRSDSTEMTAGI